MGKQGQKLFIVKKYVMAASAAQAIRRESKLPVDDVWVDEEWKKGNVPNLAQAIGFNVQLEHE